jgi:UDP-3-O-[3-hydroxymyristoyl] N-acetylglucosamine deacetylase
LEQKHLKKFIKVLKKVEVKDGPKYISIEPLTKDLIIDFEIVYKNPLIRTRRKKFKLSNGDLTSIYNSRTFCLYEDIDQIRNQGLAKGGSLENAIVVKEGRILNDNGLRNRDEFVGHKILDCIGDLMLSGHRIFGHIKTTQGGHQLTNTLLDKFLSNKSNWEFESFEGKEEDNKDTDYLSSVAVNA